MVDVERAREFSIRARGQMREGNTRVAFVLLARAFRALEHAAGLDPWNPVALYHWAVENLHTDAERYCARFILGVWNQDDIDAEHGGQLGRFDALQALATRGHAHRAAFAVWALDPWWP